MGIGAALAMGLARGFHGNIQEEKGRRLAETQKVDAMEQTALQAVLTGDATKSGYSAVTDIIQSARKDLKDRPKIDIFGRATDGIDIDMAKLQGVINDTEEFGVTFGTGENRIGFTSDISKGIDAKLGRAYLSEMSGFANRSDYEAKLDKLTNQEFINLYSSMGAARSAIVQASKSGEKEYPIDVMGAEDSDMFRGLYKLDDYSNNRFKNGVPRSATGTGMNISKIEQLVMPLAEDHKNNTGVMPDTVGMPTVSNANQPDIITYTNKSDKEALQMIADGLGVDPVTAYAYWQTEFMAIPDIDPEDQRRAFDASVYLGANVQDIANLDPDEGLLYMLSEQAIKSIVTKAKVSGATDLQAFAYALAPYMQGEKKPSEPRTWGTRRKQRQERIQNYILRRVYGENKADQVSFKDFRDAQTALESTFTRITELETEIKGLDAPSAYDAYKGKLYAIFDPEQGLFGGLLKDFNLVTEGDGLNVGDKENLTAEYGKYLNAKIDAASKTGGVNAAKLEAMRISLAFEMARAADPSGRLSNQDIEQQLKKLGQPFQTVRQALAAIEIAKGEFKTKAEQYKVLVRLGESQKIATERDYQIIDGTIAADYLLRRSTVPTASAEQATSIDISNIIETPSGKIINGNTGLTATAAEIEAFNNQGTQ